MKRPSLVLLLGAVAGFAAFALASRMQTQSPRRLLETPGSELAWLRHEFHLSEEQYQKVLSLHRAYQPTCAELCRQIEKTNQRLREAIAATNAVTEEVRTALSATGQARDACRQAMLTHLYAVAREMPPEAGQRYLDTMLSATCVIQEARPRHSAPAPDADPHRHHDE